jgi:hypothetical protein
MRRLVYFAVIVAVLSVRVHAEKHIDPRLEAVYAHFVGNWQGTDDFVEDGKAVHIPVRISITVEGKHGAGLRMEYTYSEKGDSHYKHDFRHMILYPEKSTADLWWGDDPIKGHYEVIGIDELLSKGYGSFALVDKGKDADGSQEKCVLHLGPEEFWYTWQRTSGGFDSPPRSAFNLSRVQ